MNQQQVDTGTKRFVFGCLGIVLLTFAIFVVFILLVVLGAVLEVQ